MCEGEDEGPSGNLCVSSKLSCFLEFKKRRRDNLPVIPTTGPTKQNTQGSAPNEKIEHSSSTPKICFYSAVRLTSGSK